MRRLVEDGWISDFHADGDTVHRHLWRADTREILEENAEMRRDAHLVRNLEWCGWELRIPEEVREFLHRTQPDLDCPDKEVQRAAWLKFMDTPLGKACKVR